MGMGRKTLFGGSMKGVRDLMDAAESMRSRQDPTLPADSDPKMGAGPLRPSQQRGSGTGATLTGLSARERKLRDEFFGLKKSARRAEQLKGPDSRFAKFFEAQARLEREASEVDQPEVGDRDPTIIRKRTPSEPPPDKTVIIDGKRYKRGDTKAIERARTLARVKEKLLARSGGDEEGMKAGGLKTRKTRKTAEAYKEYMKPSEVKKRKQKVKTAASAKRKQITENIMSAAKGGMAGKKPRNANIDYRKGGMFYVGGTSAKVTPINKGKK
tara:strand:+ start:1734 stop:2543 length:810 start_codon:yes stop_codon:yes gene_type:complete